MHNDLPDANLFDDLNKLEIDQQSSTCTGHAQENGGDRFSTENMYTHHASTACQKKGPLTGETFEYGHTLGLSRPRLRKFWL